MNHSQNNKDRIDTYKYELEDQGQSKQLPTKATTIS